MKNILIKCGFTMFLLFLLTSCLSIYSLNKETKLRIGVTSIPHGEILENIKNIFKIDFDIVNYADYDSLNMDLIDGKIDANFFQTREYLDKFNLNSEKKLVELTGVHIEPLIIYSSKYKFIDKIDNNISVYIPSDVVNRNRSLKLLESAGLIKVSIDDVEDNYILTENSKNLIITEMKNNMIPTVFKQVDLVVMNTNVALENQIYPHVYGIFNEDSFSDKKKVNVFVTREDMTTSVKLKQIAYYLNSYETAKFINGKYKGFVKFLF